jgi:hypothetical protein
MGNVYMNKKILSFLSAIVMLISGVKYAKSESTPTVPPTSPTDITQEQKSKAEELFGWIDNGETYRLATASIAKLTVDGIEKKIICVRVPGTPVMYYNEDLGKIECYVFGDRVTGKEHLRYPTSGREPIASKEYF